MDESLIETSPDLLKNSCFVEGFLLRNSRFNRGVSKHATTDHHQGRLDSRQPRKNMSFHSARATSFAMQGRTRSCRWERSRPHR